MHIRLRQERAETMDPSLHKKKCLFAHAIHFLEPNPIWYKVSALASAVSSMLWTWFSQYGPVWGSSDLCQLFCSQSSEDPAGITSDLGWGFSRHSCHHNSPPPTGGVQLSRCCISGSTTQSCRRSCCTSGALVKLVYLEVHQHNRPTRLGCKSIP